MTQIHQFKNPVPDSSSINQSDFDDLLELQSSILGVAASSDVYSELTRKLCIMAEQLVPDSVASIMLYDRDDDKLYVHTAPNIPQAAIDALNGLQVGVGSCGNAVYHDQAMYVCNTFQDKRWSEVKSFAETFDIASCWSLPIHNDNNEVIGTFALSSFEERQPSNFQRKLLHTCASIAGILLQKERFIQQSEEWEKETLRAEKLESIGVLAGGIAHDFNNLLGIVIGNIGMTLRAVDEESKEHGYLLSASKASKRAAELTQQLLTFSKGGDPVKKLSNLRETINESAEFVLHGSGIAVSFVCPNEADCQRPLIADIDNGQIGQVIRNIILNARQAMGNSGEVIIDCCATSEVPEALQSKLKAERYHRITIQDTGPGISPEDVDKIFDPYFTTKAGGSGLGLALSFSIIKKHDGHISVESTLGEGTQFTIYLPASEAIVETGADNVVSLESANCRGRVMVMDDQQMLHDVAEAMLDELGYQTLHAVDGEQAVEMYDEAVSNGETIDMVIMDLTIPGGMGGKEAVQEVLAIDDEAKVIVSSGYSNDAIMARYQEYGFKGALTKPYDLNELETLLEQVATA